MKRRFGEFILTVGLGALAALALAACSVKASGGGGGDPGALPGAPAPEAFSHKVSGPEVEGTWASACLFDSYKTKYKLMSIQFTGQSIKRNASLYNDAQCTQVFKKVEDIGTFRWVWPTSYGGFLMDYRLDAGNGIVAITGEELLLDGDVMYLSDFHMGFGSIDKNYPMKKAGTTSGSQPAPKPNPSPAPNPAPAPAPCADFRGTFYQNGYYNSIDQRECKELVWQGLYSDMSPSGQPDVYIMDGQPHTTYGGKQITSYYKDGAFFLDFRESGNDVSLEFRMLSGSTITCMGYSSGRPTLMRKGKVNGVESSNYCRTWEKIK